jgi:hypothetical protein
MKRQIGILIMKDENDILDEYLSKIVQYYDNILVLDGSDPNEGGKICSKFPEVIFYEKDKNVINENPNDSIRGFLWEKAKKIATDKEWVGVLHPDEFPSGNVLEMLESVNNTNVNSVVVRNLHFFLHTSQREGWDFKPGDLIEPRMKWHMAPGFPEHRYFRFNRNFNYENRHGLVIPPAATINTIEVANFYYKQFSFRTREQSLKRARSRWESGWQMDDYCLVLETEDIFFDTLKYPPEYAKKYPSAYNRCWYNRDWSYVNKLP